MCKKKHFYLVGRLEKCSDYRLKADYKDDFLQVNNVNYLKKTLDIFDEIYDEILEIMDVERFIAPLSFKNNCDKIVYC